MRAIGRRTNPSLLDEADGDPGRLAWSVDECMEALSWMGFAGVAADAVYLEGAAPVVDAARRVITVKTIG